MRKKVRELGERYTAPGPKGRKKVLLLYEITAKKIPWDRYGRTAILLNKV